MLLLFARAGACDESCKEAKDDVDSEANPVLALLNRVFSFGEDPRRRK